ncbi:hypothetical protein BDV18DRAFT_155862 [Aspergillus unguis]
MPQMRLEPPSDIQYQQQYLNPTSSFLQDPSPVPSSSNKENAAPPDHQAQVPSSSSTERVPDSLPASQSSVVSTTLSAPLFLILQSIQSTLRSLFTSKPPHTIQRLAELILRPTAHYKTLPAYLRAVDRVVSVTSSADVFPFPMQSGAANAQPNGVLNGADNMLILPDNALGSDESLGGALLTPIPWLNNTASPAPEEAVSLTESASTIPNQLPTQPADPATHQTPALDTEGNSSILEGELTADPSEEIPHARGPSLLGVEDMGLQDGKGVEMTLLSKEGETGADASSATEESLPAASKDSTAESTTAVAESSTASGSKDAITDADGDGDITLSDDPTIPQGGQDGGEKKS